MKRLSAFLLLPLSSAHAADTSTALPPAGTGLVQVFIALGLVIVLLLGSMHFLKRLQGGRSGPAGNLRVVGATAVGPRERVVVVEIGDQWLVVGVAPGQVSALTTLPRQPMPETAPQAEAGSDFASRLKQLMEFRK